MRITYRSPMHAWLAVLLTVLIAPPVIGQTASVQDGALQDWTRLKDTMVKISDAMPEDKFGYRATPAQRTCGEQILHIAEANVNQMGRFGSKAVVPASVRF